MSLKSFFKKLARSPLVTWIIAAIISLPFLAQQRRERVSSDEERHAIMNDVEGGASPAYGSLDTNNLKSLVLVRPIADVRKRARRFIIVGDVHGCKAELVALLAEVNFKHTYDHLILAGDFVCKGPDTHGVIALARSLNASCVRGNHEAKLLEAYESGAGAGDANKKNSAADLASRLPLSDLKWISSWPAILDLGPIAGLPYKTVAVVHAGLAPHVALEKQDAFLVMNMRAMDPKTYEPFEDRKDGEPWSSVWNHEQKKLHKDKRTLVVYGHDSKTGLNVRNYSIGLDSGCVKGGELSAYVIELGSSKPPKVVSVKSRQANA